MEPRKITVVSTKSQKKSVIMSNATTLEELKRDLDAANIDYTDMTFYEGISKIELIDNASVLPHDIPYKGQVTNELVFMLTNTNKKIKSGTMTRSEVYSIIKSKNLQNICLQKFGKNFTMCKTDDLISLIDSIGELAAPVSKSEGVDTPEEDIDEIPDKDSVGNCKDKDVKQAIYELIYYLAENNVIPLDKANKILGIIGVAPVNIEMSNISSSYSDDEISDMFSTIL